jgi:hypothetical protein
MNIGRSTSCPENKLSHNYKSGYIYVSWGGIIFHAEFLMDFFSPLKEIVE